MHRACPVAAARRPAEPGSRVRAMHGPTRCAICPSTAPPAASWCAPAPSPPVPCRPTATAWSAPAWRWCRSPIAMCSAGRPTRRPSGRPRRRPNSACGQTAPTATRRPRSTSTPSRTCSCAPCWKAATASPCCRPASAPARNPTRCACNPSRPTAWARQVCPTGKNATKPEACASILPPAPPRPTTCTTSTPARGTPVPVAMAKASGSTAWVLPAACACCTTSRKSGPAWCAACPT